MMSVVGALQPDLIAVVDDDESFRKAVQNVLRSAGLQVRAFASAEDFLRSGQLGQTACLISDIQMPGMNGLELLGKLVTEERRIPVVFITGYGTARLRNQAQQLGAVQVLDKPFDAEVLLETIREVTGA